MEKKQIYNIKTFFALIIILLLMFSCITMSEQIKTAIEYSLASCLSIIVPSLYGFMIIADFTVISSISNIIGLPFRFISERIFKIPANACGIFILSLIGGYPVGAKCISTLLETGQIDKKGAENFYNFFFASGPAFIMGTVGIQLYNSSAVGVAIFISITLSNIILAFISGIGKPIPQRNDTKNKPKITLSIENIIKSVQNSAKALLQVCSMIVAFSVVIEILLQYDIIEFICNIFHISVNFVLTFLEISHITDFPHNNYTNLPLITALLSFGGVCVLLQIITISKGKINLPKFLFSRLFCSICSAFLCQLIIKTFPNIFIISTVSFKLTSPSNISIIPSVCLIIMTILLLNSHKARE